MNGQGTSDRPVVPAKLPNNAGAPAAEAVEGRGLAKGNADQQTTPRTQRRTRDRRRRHLGRAVRQPLKPACT
jgi:hypothetical protein